MKLLNMVITTLTVCEMENSQLSSPHLKELLEKLKLLTMPFQIISIEFPQEEKQTASAVWVLLNSLPFTPMVIYMDVKR